MYTPMPIWRVGARTDGCMWQVRYGARPACVSSHSAVHCQPQRHSLPPERQSWACMYARTALHTHCPETHSTSLHAREHGVRTGPDRSRPDRSRPDRSRPAVRVMVGVKHGHFLRALRRGRSGLRNIGCIAKASVLWMDGPYATGHRPYVMRHRPSTTSHTIHHTPYAFGHGSYGMSRTHTP